MNSRPAGPLISKTFSYRMSSRCSLQLADRPARD